MKKVVLIGTGPAHLLALERFGRAPLLNAELAVVSLGMEQVYSGKLSAYLAGEVPLEGVRIDVAALAARAGAQLFPSGAIRVDADARRIELGTGDSITYDFASVNVGAALVGDDRPGVREHASLVKPVGNVADLDLSSSWKRLLVVGGGAAGVELAFCLRARTGAHVMLATRAPRIPQGSSAQVDRLVRGLLAKHDIEVWEDSVEALQDGKAVMCSGQSVQVDRVVWATGPRAPSLVRECGAASNPDGYLAVAATLRSTSHPSLFGAGDCVDIDGEERVQKSGVYSVREARVLSENLRAVSSGSGLLRRYHPQRRALYILNVGDGTGVAIWGRFAVHGRLARRLKERLDDAFMSKFRNERMRRRQDEPERGGA